MNLRTDKHKDNHMHSRDKSNSQSFKDADSTFCGSPFVVGQHVVYVNDEMPSQHALDRWNANGFERPTKNKVYTVREIFIGTHGGPVLLLREIINPLGRMLDGSTREPGFDARRFRPLQKLKLEDFMPIVEHLTDEVRA